MNITDILGSLGVHNPSPIFTVLLVFHILAGMTCVFAGAVAIVSRKRHGRHPRFGTIYYWSLLVVFISSTGMAGIRWSNDAHLFVLGTIAFTVASIGYAARRIRWEGWTTIHIMGMSLSYIVLLTAFYVDNGPNLPLWKLLPTIVFWIGPSIIGLPILALALRRHTHLISDLRATFRAATTLVGHTEPNDAEGGRILKEKDQELRA